MLLYLGLAAYFYALGHWGMLPRKLALWLSLAALALAGLTYASSLYPPHNDLQDSPQSP